MIRAARRIEGAFKTEQWKGATPSGAKLDRLQYLRAFAAFAVVVWHATYHLWSVRGDRRLLDVMPQLGAFGVTLFFVISGYLMATLSEKSRVTHFLAHRVLRIYPIYWLCLIAFYLINEKLLNFGFYIDRFAIFLIPGGPWPYKLGVEWTLPFELVFYVVIFAIMLARFQRYLLWFASAWAFAVIVLMLGPPGRYSGQFPPLPYLLVSPWILPFIGGIFVAKARCSWRLSILALIVGAIICAAGLASASRPLVMAWLLTAGSMCLVVWGTSRDQTGAQNRLQRSLVRLGDWSYALYLCHNSILLWIYKLAPAHASNLLLLLAAIVTPVLASAWLGRADMAMYGALKRRVDSATPVVPVVIGIVFLGGLIVMSALAPKVNP